MHLPGLGMYYHSVNVNIVKFPIQLNCDSAFAIVAAVAYEVHMNSFIRTMELRIGVKS